MTFGLVEVTSVAALGISYSVVFPRGTHWRLVKAVALWAGAALAGGGTANLLGASGDLAGRAAFVGAFVAGAAGLFFLRARRART